MSQDRKNIFLGILSFLPLLSICVLFGASLLNLYIDITVAFIAPMLAISMTCGLGLVFYFLYITVNHPELSMIAKVAWVITLASAGIIALPVFWALFIRDNKQGAALA